MILRNLSEPDAAKVLFDHFRTAINTLTIHEGGSSRIDGHIRLRDTRPFRTGPRGFLPAKKSVFNRIVGEANADALELEFAAFLESASDVQAFGKNYMAVGFKIEFVKANGELSTYTPDFIVRTTDGKVWVVATKGREEIDVPQKMARLGQWCEDATEATKDDGGPSYHFVYVDQESFKKHKPSSFREALEETYGKGADLRDCVLIVTAANNDGIRAERGKKRKLLITDELDKFSDAFFGNAGNVTYFLKTDRAESKNEYTEPKPVLSGCDAHSLTELDEKLGQVVSDATDGIVHEPTWIKADLTFEGLKQIIFEPANRVFIGAEPDIERRVRENRTRYIESLHINCVEGYRQDQHGSWFCDEKIVLGKELVAIIGNKGSGKSAVTDIIGLLGNSHNQMSKGLSGAKSDELFSFLNKEKFLKGGCAKHFLGVLNWYEGEPDRKQLDALVATHLPEKVEYLPQKYLERICANIADDEFRSTLNEVIFRYVKPQDQHGQKNLDDLIQYRTQQAQEDIAQKKQELHQANANVVAVEKKLTEEYRKELEEKIRLKNEDLEAHAKAKPEEKQNPDTGAGTASRESAQVEQLTQRITALADQIATLEAEQVTVSAAVCCGGFRLWIRSLASPTGEVSMRSWRPNGGELSGTTGRCRR